ncbi:hypothetical protein LguiB_000640 [Lonicera macranthoides]
MAFNKERHQDENLDNLVTSCSAVTSGSTKWYPAHMFATVFDHLSLSTSNLNSDPSNDEFDKAHAVNVSSVYTMKEATIFDLSSMYYLLP